MQGLERFSGGGSFEWQTETRIYLVLNSLSVAMFFAISMRFSRKLLKINKLMVEAAGVERFFHRLSC
jgi:hypothetical protein